MPAVSSPVPPPDNKHLIVPSLSRNDSLKSERSDKRVSFNNDVGVKHIPRGVKPSNHNNQPLPPSKSKALDEWDRCAPVKLQKNNLTAEQLEKEAAKLVNLVDSINCEASPLPSKKYKDFSSKSLDRSQNNQNRNGDPPLNTLNYNRITNPIIRHLKADVNKRENNRGRNSLQSDSDSESYYRYRHQSVPDLTGTHYNHNNIPNGLGHGNYKSYDNLLEEKNTNIIQAAKQPRTLYSKNNHVSADNLLDVEHKRSNLSGYKSVGDLPSYSDSDSSSHTNYNKRPKVSQLIRRHSEDPDSNNLHYEAASQPRIAPPRRNRSRNSHSLGYSKPSSVNISEKSLPTKTNKNIEDMYAQVNKHGLTQRLSTDSDYSAKIIITEDKQDRNRYDEDDDVYETFNVQNNASKSNRYNDYGLHFSRDDITSKNNSLNNNMNMSSIGIQTDGAAKISNRGRHPKGVAPLPPLDRHYENYNPANKDLGSPTADLTSTDLVRQINHGFGRFDRSPSPPRRKVFNHQKTHRPHIPLLSDASDSEYEYKRRSDPMTKIRNQVLREGRLQEEHDAEEWEEKEYERYHRNKVQNENGMRPLTLDEVDALSVEFDQHGDRKLVLSNKSDKKASTLQTSNQYSQRNVVQQTEERAYSEERSKPTKPLREKPIRDENRKTISPEPVKKNTTEKVKSISEKKEKENETFFSRGTLKFKGKDKKNKDTIKDKKKKRIKIKFFYDPKPQNKEKDDPLNRFTEYKGEEKAKSPKAPRSKSYDSRSQSRDRNSHDEVSGDPRYTRDSSRERTLRSAPKPNRINRGASTEKLNYVRSDYSSNESHDGRRRRVRSTDSFQNDRSGYENRTDYQTNTISREERRNRLGYGGDTLRLDKDRRGYRSVDDFDSHRKPVPSHNAKDRYFDSVDSSEEAALRRRSTFLERREAYEKRDTAIKREKSFSPTPRSGDGKRIPYSERAVDGPYKNESDVSPTREDKYISSPDSDEKQERVMRQRKKFLSALMTDGRAKSTNSPPRKAHFNGATTTLNRSMSSVNQTEKRPDRRYDPGHESDQPSLHSSRLDVKRPQSTVQATPSKKKDNVTDSAKSSLKKTKKKKRKPWPWSFLGLRGNSSKRKNNPPPSSRNSEVGSTYGTNRRGQIQALNNSRPTSRASSHRSSLRNRHSRPSVRASKIRKDAGESSRSYSSKRHDKQETKHWESATIQRTSAANRNRDAESRKNRDSSNQRDYERFHERGSRNVRKISDGSSGSSPPGIRRGPAKRSPSFKQRYFGDSDTDHRPRPYSNGAGPGDYRSLPNRSARNTLSKRGGNTRRVPGGGSAGSSLQSSESENDSHHGSRASHVSTGSNRSVYLHATAVADIPVQKEDSERGSVQRQARKVTRSFSLAAPWKPKHNREMHYDAEGRRDRNRGRHTPASKPPRPPRKPSVGDSVNRSQTLTNKDSKLSGWLKKRKGREGKGI